MLLLTGRTLLLTDVILLVTERILLITVRDGTLTVTLLDLCLLFEHHNRVHWAQTWEDICVTFIYFIYHIFTDLPTWRPSLIFLHFYTDLITVGTSQKVDFRKGRCQKV